MTPDPSPALQRAQAALQALEAEDAAERVQALEEAATALDSALSEDAG